MEQFVKNENISPPLTVRGYKVCSIALWTNGVEDIYERNRVVGSETKRFEPSAGAGSPLPPNSFLFNRNVLPSIRSQPSSSDEVPLRLLLLTSHSSLSSHVTIDHLIWWSLTSEIRSIPFALIDSLALLVLYLALCWSNWSVILSETRLRTTFWPWRHFSRRNIHRTPDTKSATRLWLRPLFESGKKSKKIYPLIPTKKLHENSHKKEETFDRSSRKVDPNMTFLSTFCSFSLFSHQKNNSRIIHFPKEGWMTRNTWHFNEGFEIKTSRQGKTAKWYRGSILFVFSSELWHKDVFLRIMKDEWNGLKRGKTESGMEME